MLEFYKIVVLLKSMKAKKGYAAYDTDELKEYYSKN